MIRWALRRAIDTIECNHAATNIRDMIDARPRCAGTVSRVAHLLAAACPGLRVRACPTGSGTSFGPASRRQPLHPDPQANHGQRGRRDGTHRRGDRWAALARSAGRIGNGNGRRGAIVALVLGPIALVIGGLVVATADGGPYTLTPSGSRPAWPPWWG